MLARAFLELFVAGFIQVSEQLQADGTVRLYRLEPGIDVDLLSPTERLLAKCLEKFRTFRELFQFESPKIGKEANSSPALPEDLLSRQTELLAETGEVIDEALEYLPPVCSCSV